MIEPTLPGMPPDPPAGASPPAGVRVHRYRQRRLCGDCVALIHELGVAQAPFPKQVAWQVCRGALVLHLCEEHKSIRVEAMRK